MLPEIQTHLLQLKWLLILLIALVCPLLALMLGGTTVSLASAGLNRRAGLKKPPAWVNALLKRANPSAEHDTLVVLTVIASLLLVKIIYRPHLFSNAAWAGLIIALTMGLGLMVACRYKLVSHRPPNRTVLAAGMLGVLLVTACCLVLSCTESLLLTPEYWPFLPRLPYLFLSWHGLVRFVEFLLLTGAITGNALLFSRATPPPAPDPINPADHIAKRIGFGLILGSLLLWPLALCLDMTIIPSLALSRLLSGLSILSVALAGLAAVLLVTIRCRSFYAPRFFFVIVVLLFWCWAFMGHTARERILVPVAVAGLAIAPSAATTQPQPATPVKPMAPAVTDISGQRLFEQKCSVCHRFDQRVVGPPLNSVIPDYRKTPDALAAFLLQPVKRNPDYPAMPNLGLTTAQAQALADYLFRYASP
ncbi:menaquinol oxidoreductase complex ACIII, membrane protein and cytochrome c subunit ActE, 1 heme-binding site [Syntrophotalea carbinolica DSM 2380]|uniref:Menaquinol oxidoreductase complex ACIII, membrane protein and cytochrome c subunit ActE, 1 heme-binding site n=1 Tax=Syntrophotalea carbinolica (strain DSM 2380 / NBRC 103641 / GraBd1) TaxID=338963 RepID=Q3A1H0_SYNC1|nr:cytochrome c [Syntrophotalea carbinolica]ABA89787.1 menaquinol oxidoreductase complex ACIII, membrane protein and cytochrome c subunit ActE, 1 heme-binding site [Syntrophotalea carbinolica DSM 2380]